MNIFNWKPNEPKNIKTPTEIALDRLWEELQESKKFAERWERDRADLWKAIKDISEAQGKKSDTTALEQRIILLETWRLQLHNLLTEKGNTGKDKLSRTGNTLSKFYQK